MKSIKKNKKIFHSIFLISASCWTEQMTSIGSQNEINWNGAENQEWNQTQISFDFNISTFFSFDIFEKSHMISIALFDLAG